MAQFYFSVSKSTNKEQPMVVIPTFLCCHVCLERDDFNPESYNQKYNTKSTGGSKSFNPLCLIHSWAC